MSRHKPSMPVLVQDILLRILCSCDITTVLTATPVNRTFHALATSKYVWLGLLFDLHRRGFIDLRPGQRLKDFSKDELVGLAKRAVHGPRTWATSDPNDLPAISRQVVLKNNIQRVAGVLHWVNDPQLLPGGRFLLFQNRGTLECRSIIEDRSIWEYKSKARWTSSTVQMYTSDMIYGGEAVILLLGIRTYESERKNFLEVVRLDLNTGLATSLLLKAAPDTSYDNPFRCVKVRGDFAVAAMNSQDGIFMTVQISTGNSSILHSSPVFDIDLITDHVVMSGPSAPEVDSGHCHLRIWPSRALVACDEEYASLDTIDPVVNITIDVSSVSYRSVGLASHLSPLSDSTCIIWAVFSAPSSSFVYKYRARYSPSQVLSVTPLSSWGRQENVRRRARNGFSISFAGAVDLWENENVTVLPLAGIDKPLRLPAVERVHISAYSGAIAYATGDLRIIINYYE
ncbi:hypothetical protein LshimejAT787_0705030 [Lyophyllum shimeji]|uniref:F-box domain-containing protein n=1 Tax=Lyophyllum shimeji TaxID=47721 RepID=A0A9P3PR03_LYOSH|nr:hypothetical protein LshimejAT787_0705030 [Lyophyllum shimeji]